MSLYQVQKLIYQLNRDPRTRERYERERDAVLGEYELTAEEKKALDAIEQIGDAITSRRRELFTRALFTRSYSILSPDLWIAAGRALPGEARAAAFVTRDWLSGLADRLRGAEQPVGDPYCCVRSIGVPTAVYPASTREDRDAQ